MPIYRVRLIGDSWNFNNKEEADKFVEDDKGSGYEYTVAPATEDELQKELRMMANEIANHGDKMKHSHPQQYNELLMRIEAYQDALTQLRMSTATIDDAQMSRYVHHLVIASTYLAPTGEIQESFANKVNDMGEDGESHKSIAIELLRAMLDGLRLNSWPF